MKKEKDEAFDDLFKKKLADPVDEAGYRDEDWDALEQMLDGGKRRPAIVFWLPILSSAAALLIFFGWWFFKPQVAGHGQKQQVMLVKANPRNTAGAESKSNEKRDSISKESPAVIAKNESHSIVKKDNRQQPKASEPNKGNTGRGSYMANAASKEKRDNETVAHSDIAKTNDNKVPQGVVLKHTEMLTAVQNDLLADNSRTHRQLVSNGHVDGLSDNGAGYIDRDAIAKMIKKEEGGNSGVSSLKHPQLALTVIGASELNSVNSIQGSKAGSNFGVLFSAGVNKLTISTGATYSTKPYDTNIANYHTPYTFANSPTNIEADCRVLDIPINVDYQLYNRNKNKFSIGTGVSSYMMLHESYDYYYATATTAGPSGYTVKNPGKYLFGVMNLQATYQRQINSKVGLSIQPYMKLPLTNIGYSQSKLQTTGVAIGLNWNLNSLTKP